MLSQSGPDNPVEAPDCRQLFLGFLALGLISFGGALPHARHALVERRRWLTHDQFMELLGLCQFLPGGNVIDLSVATGMHFRGIRGALCGLLGLILGPSAIVIGLGVLYQQFRDNLLLQHVFGGLAAAAAGLLIATAIKCLQPMWQKWRPMLIVGCFFVVIALLRWPLLPCMLVLTPFSIWLISRKKS